MLKKVEMPFNKDYATIGQSKDALESLEQLFEMIERFPEEEVDEDYIGQLAFDIYEAWQKKYPKKD